MITRNYTNHIVEQRYIDVLTTVPVNLARSFSEIAVARLDEWRKEKWEYKLSQRKLLERNVETLFWCILSYFLLIVTHSGQICVRAISSFTSFSSFRSSLNFILQATLTICYNNRITANENARIRAMFSRFLILILILISRCFLEGGILFGIPSSLLSLSRLRHELLIGEIFRFSKILESSQAKFLKHDFLIRRINVRW